MRFWSWGRVGLLLELVIGLSGCHRPASTGEEKVRHELQIALREHSYERAEGLARRALEFSPNDNSGWGHPYSSAVWPA